MSYRNQSRLSEKQFHAAQKSTDPVIQHLLRLREDAYTDSRDQCTYDRKIQDLVNIRGSIDDYAYDFNTGMMHNPQSVPAFNYPGAGRGGGIITSFSHRPDNYYGVVLPSDKTAPWRGWVPWNPADFGPSRANHRDHSRQHFRPCPTNPRYLSTQHFNHSSTNSRDLSEHSYGDEQKVIMPAQNFATFDPSLISRNSANFQFIKQCKRCKAYGHWSAECSQ